MPSDPAQRPTIAVPVWVWAILKQKATEQNKPVGLVVADWAKSMGFREPPDRDGGISR